MKWHENLGDGVKFKLNFKTEVELFASKQLVAGEAAQNCREVCIPLPRETPGLSRPLGCSLGPWFCNLIERPIFSGSTEWLSPSLALLNWQFCLPSPREKFAFQIKERKKELFPPPPLLFMLQARSHKVQPVGQILPWSVFVQPQN